MVIKIDIFFLGICLNGDELAHIGAPTLYFYISTIGLQDSKGVTDIMSLLDDFAMDLASGMEKLSPTNVDNATIDVKMDNVGE